MADEQVVFGGSITLSILIKTPVGPQAVVDIYYIDIDVEELSIEDAIAEMNKIPAVQIHKEIY
jgi:hypothetical protein